MADNDPKSLTGEPKAPREYGGAYAWSRNQAVQADAKVHVWQKNNKDLGSTMSYQDYLRSKSDQAENGGVPPDWKAADLTSFVAADAQSAINTLKDVVDQTLFFTQSAAQAATLLSGFLSSHGNAIETLVNEVRKEIKDILDHLLGLGGVYALPIYPNESGQPGGVDYYSKTFLSSLDDRLDIRRPMFGDNTKVHALFFLFGFPWPRYPYFLDKLFSTLVFSIDKRSTSVNAALPPPGNFNVAYLFAPEYKLLKQDSAYRDANVVRRVLSYVNFTDTPQAIQSYVTWKIPDQFSWVNTTGAYEIVEYVNTSSASHEVPRKRTSLSTSTFIEPDSAKADETTPVTFEFQKITTRILYWVLVRSTFEQEIAAISEGSPVIIDRVMALINNGNGDLLQDKPNDKTGAYPTKKIGSIKSVNPDTGAEESVDVIVHGSMQIYVGIARQLNTWKSDTDITRPTQAEIDRILGRLDTVSQPDVGSTTYFYKMCFVGDRVVQGKLFVATGTSDEGTKYDVYYSKTDIWKNAANNGRYYGYLSPAERAEQAAGSTPTVAPPDDTRVVQDLSQISANDFWEWYWRCDKIPEGRRASTDVTLLFSPFTETKHVVNDTVQSPDAIPPDWYSIQLSDFLPPFKEFINKAKAFVDLVADNIIEAIHDLTEYVQAVLESIKTILRKVEELMNFLKSLLFPPMAGGHVLSVTSLKGIQGLKDQFKLSFRNAPKSVTGSSDYPDEYIQFGPKHTIGKKIIDGTNQVFGANIKGDRASATPAPADTSTVSTSTQTKSATSVAANRFSAAEGKAKKRRNGPSREDLVKLGIPLYDKKHLCAGFVIVTESASVFASFVRLLNLQSFLEATGEKYKNSILGTQEFSSISLPSLKANTPKSGNQKLKARIAAANAKKSALLAVGKGGASSGTTTSSSGVPEAKTTLSEGQDNHAVLEAAQVSPVVGVFSSDTNVAPDGSQYAYSASGPFSVTGSDTTIGLSVNSIPVTVTLERTDPPKKPLYSAEAIASKINGAYKEALLKKYPGLLLSAVQDLLSFDDNGSLLFKSPPAFFSPSAFPSKPGAAQTLGDGSGVLEIGHSSYPLLKPGTKISRIKLDDFTQVTAPFPVRNGEYTVELADFGVPSLDMLRATPAVYEMNDFITDPAVQDFNPAQCRLLIEVDTLGKRRIDVTGNAGAYPKDAPPSVKVVGDAGDLIFPLVINRGNNKFRVSVTGNFKHCENLANVHISPYLSLISIPGYDFFGQKARIDDYVFLTNSGGITNRRRILSIEGDTLTLDGIVPYAVADKTVVIQKIVRGSKPPLINDATTPSLVRTLTLGAANLPDTPGRSDVVTYKTVSDLAKAVSASLYNVGLTPDIITVTATDTSQLANGSKGYLSLTLDKSWAIGNDTSLQVLPTTDIGTAAGIETPTLSYPLQITSARSQFRIQLFKDYETTADFKTVTIPVGTYASASLFAAALTTAISTAGLSEVKAKAIGDRILFYINIYDPITGLPLAKHYAYSNLVGLRLKPLVPLAANSVLFTFPVGVGIPPKAVVPLPLANFTVADGYGDTFTFSVTPTVGTRPSTAVTAKIAPKEYGSLSALKDGIANALTSVGYPKDSFLILGTLGTSLLFSLKPEASYVSPAAVISLTTRPVPASLTAPSVTLAELRDYNYVNVNAYIAAHKNDNPPPAMPGFDNPADRVFVKNPASTGAYYPGDWTVTAGVNDSFQVRVKAPGATVSLPTDWATVTLPAGNYTTAANIATGNYPGHLDFLSTLQTALNTALGGSGILTASLTATDGITLTTANASLQGKYATLEVRAYGTSAFFCYGTQSAAALNVHATGTGDRTFLEVAGLSAIYAYGDYDFFHYLGLDDSTSPKDADGVGYLEARGVSNYDFLGLINMSPTEGLGSYVLTYTLKEVVQAINAAFAGFNPNYKKMAEISPITGRLRINGRVPGRTGQINIIAKADPLIVGSAESEAVAAQLFGFLVPREGQVSIQGIGERPTSALLEVELVDEDPYIVELISAEAFEVLLVTESHEIEILDDELLAEVVPQAEWRQRPA